MDINLIMDEIVTFYNENSQLVLLIVAVNLLLVVFYAILARRRHNKLLMDSKKEFEAITEDPEAAKAFLKDNSLISEDYLHKFNDLDEDDDFIVGVDADEQEQEINIDDLGYTPLEVLTDEIGEENTFDFSHFDDYQKDVSDELLQEDLTDEEKEIEVEANIDLEQAFEALSKSDPIQEVTFDEGTFEDESVIEPALDNIEEESSYVTEDDIRIDAYFEENADAGDYQKDIEYSVNEEQDDFETMNRQDPIPYVDVEREFSEADFLEEEVDLEPVPYHNPDDELVSEEQTTVDEHDLNDYDNYVTDEEEVVPTHEIQESIYKEFASNFDIKETEAKKVEVLYDLEDTYDDEEGELIDLKTLEKYDYDLQKVNQELDHHELTPEKQEQDPSDSERLSREATPLTEKVIDEGKYDSYLKKLKEFRSSL